MNAYLKLFISDILELKKSPDSYRYIFNDFAFRNVEVIGIVKRMKEVRKGMFIYEVDDGTGVIECVRFDNEEPIPQRLEGMEKISKILMEKVYAANKVVPVGSTLKLRGYISDYKRKREIKIRALKPILDKNEELIHNYQKLALYQNVYCKKKL